jgi:hypothetical protein
MFCPSCGMQAGPGMRFCKQCGTSVTQTTGVVPTSFPTAQHGRSGRGVSGIAWATAVLGICGLGVILGTAIPLAAIGMNPGILAVILLACIALLGGVMFMMVRQMSRLIGAGTSVSALPAPPQQSLPPAYPQPQITTGPVGMPSITEHTTKIFDPHSDRAQ